MTYLLLFLLFFNINIDGYGFMGFGETVEIFEYNIPLIFYLLFCLQFLKLFIKEKAPKNSVIIAILIFLTGISTEVQNLFFLTFWGLVNFYIIGKFLLNKTPKHKKILKFIIFLDLIYAFSIFLYYINPTDHDINFMQDYNEELLKDFSNNFLIFIIKPYWILSLIPIISSFLIFITKNRYKRIDNKIIFFSLANLFSLYFYYFVGNFLIMYVWDSSEKYFLGHDKFAFVFLIVLLFNVIVTFGYLLDTRLKNKNSLIMKSLIILLMFIFSNNIHPQEYYSTINKKRTYLKEQRICMYKLVKAIVSQKNTENIIVPQNSKSYLYYAIKITDLIYSLNFISKDFENVKHITISSKAELPLLSAQEYEDLKFSDLIIPIKKSCSGGIIWFDEEQVLYE